MLSFYKVIAVTADRNSAIRVYNELYSEHGIFDDGVTRPMLCFHYEVVPLSLRRDPGSRRNLGPIN